MISRRRMLGGLLALSAPAIIRTPGLLMPISAPKRWVGILRIVPLLHEGVDQWKGAYVQLVGQFDDMRPALDQLTWEPEPLPDLVHTVDRQRILKRMHEEEARIAAYFASQRPA